MNPILIRITLFGGLLALAACGRAAPPAPSAGEAHPQHAHAAHAAGLEAGSVAEYSVYDLDSEWWNQHGEREPLGSLAGRVQVVAMVYTHCAYTCPQMLMDMKRIEARIGDPAGLGFVLVSIDPERDTPGRLQHFAEATHLDPAAWTLLSGSDDEILELATLLGIKYRAEAGGEFSHSNTLLVLNPAGEIVHRQLGLGEDLAPMLAAIRTALPSAVLARGG